MKYLQAGLFVLIAMIFASAPLALALDKITQDKVDKKKQVIVQWAADPMLVKAVKEFNTNPPTQAKELTQDRWEKLTILDDTVQYFQTSDAAKFLESKKEDWVSEAFVSAADGKKVGFLAKTSSWSHVGKAKHDMPMTGTTWQGKFEMDDSVGRMQVEIGVPVMDGDTPIGSLVIGIDVGKL